MMHWGNLHGDLGQQLDVTSALVEDANIPLIVPKQQHEFRAAAVIAQKKQDSMMHWGNIEHADEAQRQPTVKIDESTEFVTVKSKEVQKFSASRPDVCSTGESLDVQKEATRLKSKSYPTLGSDGSTAFVGPDAQCVAEKWRKMVVVPNGTNCQDSK